MHYTRGLVIRDVFRIWFYPNANLCIFPGKRDILWTYINICYGMGIVRGNQYLHIPLLWRHNEHDGISIHPRQSYGKCCYLMTSSYVFNYLNHLRPKCSRCRKNPSIVPIGNCEDGITYIFVNLPQWRFTRIYVMPFSNFLIHCHTRMKSFIMQHFDQLEVFKHD